MECVLHPHSPGYPTEIVPLWPAARGGPIGGAALILCVEAASAVWDLLGRIEAHAETRAHDTARAVLAHAPLRWRQAFPGPERVVAYAIWLKYGDAFLRGALAQEVAAWWPDGTPRTLLGRTPARHRRRIRQP